MEVNDQLAAGAIGSDIPQEDQVADAAPSLSNPGGLANLYHNYRERFGYEGLDETRQELYDGVFQREILKPVFGGFDTIAFDTARTERQRILDEREQTTNLAEQPTLGVPESERDSAIAFSVDQFQRTLGEGLRGFSQIVGSERLAITAETFIAQQDEDIRAGGYQSTYNEGFADTVANADGALSTLTSSIGWILEKTQENAASVGSTLVGGAAGIGLRAAGRLVASRVATGVTVSSAYTQGTGAIVQELEAQGISLRDADNSTLVGGGLAIAALDLFSGLGGVSATARGGILRQVISNPSVLRRLTTAAVVEGGTEAAQELAVVFSAAAEGAQYEISDVVKRLIDGAVVGAAIGGPFGVINGAAGSTPVQGSATPEGNANQRAVTEVAQEAADVAAAPEGVVAPQAAEANQPNATTTQPNPLVAAEPAVKRNQDPEVSESRIYRGTISQTSATANRLNGQRISFGEREHVVLTGISREDAAGIQQQVDDGTLPQDAEAFLTATDGAVDAPPVAEPATGLDLTQERVESIGIASSDRANQQAQAAVETEEAAQVTQGITLANVGALNQQFQGDADLVRDALVGEAIGNGRDIAVGVPLSGINRATLSSDLPGQTRGVLRRTVAGLLARLVPGGQLSAFEGATEITNDGTFSLTAASTYGRQQMQVFNSALEPFPDLDRTVVLSALQGDADAVAQLPTEVAVATQVAREKIDNESVEILNRIVPAIAIQKAKLQQIQQDPSDVSQDQQALISSISASISRLERDATTIIGNTGRYIHRAYEVAANPVYARQALREFRAVTGRQSLAGAALVGVTSRARRADLRGRITAAQTELVAIHQAKNPDLPLREAQARADEAISGLLNTFSNRHSNPTAITSASNPVVTTLQSHNLLLDEGTVGDLGGRDSLRKRDNVPPAVRRLLGEITEPAAAYGISLSEQRKVVANHDLSLNLFDTGLEAGWIRSTADQGFERITNVTGDNNPFKILEGMYVPTSLAEGLAQYTSTSQPNNLVDTVLTINAYAKLGKTVYSPATVSRNAMGGAIMHMVMTGSLVPQHQLAREGVSVLAGSEVSGIEVEAVRRGVARAGHAAGETIGLMRDLNALQGYEADFTNATTGAERAASAHRTATRFYQAGDDYWRVSAWGRYIDTFASAQADTLIQEGASPDTRDALIEQFQGDDGIRQRAADRVVAEYPTYNQLGPFFQSLRRFPLLGPFVAFPVEVLRTSSNIMRNILSDYKSGNPTLQRFAARRALTIGGAAGALSLAARMSAEDEGLGDEELSAVLNITRNSYDANSTFMVTDSEVDSETGETLYNMANLSYINPYDILVSPINAMLRGEEDATVMEMVAAAGTQLIAPFISQEVAVGAVTEVIANEGGFIYNPEDSPLSQVSDIAGHLAVRLQPGVTKELIDIGKAVTGRRSFTGQELRLSEELIQAAGLPIRRVSISQGLSSKASAYQRNVSAASSTLTGALRDQSSLITPSTVDALTQRYDTVHREWGKMQSLVNQALSSGLMGGGTLEEQQKRTVVALRAGGIGKANANAMVQGSPPPERVASLRGINNRIKQLNAAGREQQAAELQTRVDALVERFGQTVFAN